MKEPQLDKERALNDLNRWNSDLEEAARLFAKGYSLIQKIHSEINLVKEAIK